MPRPRPQLFWPSVRAFFLLWTPRLPFLKTLRFWSWTLGTLIGAYASVMMGLNVLGARRIDQFEVVCASIAIAVPVQTIGMMVHWWLDYRRGEQRGFAVRDDAGKPEQATSIKEWPPNPDYMDVKNWH